MKNFILLLFLLIPLSNTFGSNLVVTKSTKGTDPCKRNAAGSRYVTEYLYLTIAKLQEITNFQFPIRIKAFHSTGRIIGESADIFPEDFRSIPIFPTLHEVEVPIEIYSSMVPYNEFAETCGGGSNREGTIILPVTFRVYQNDQEVPQNAEIYDDPELLPGSNVSESVVPICCPEDFFEPSDNPVHDRPENDNLWLAQFEQSNLNYPQSFSEVKTIEYQNQFENSAELRISQNPVYKGSQIRIFVPTTLQYRFAIFSSAGHQVRSGTVSSNSEEIIIDTRNLQSGHYFVQVRGSSINQTAKFVIIQ